MLARLPLLFALWLLASSCSAQGRLAIIIDDLGYNLKLGRRSLDLPGAITVAVLPFTPHAQTLANYAHSHHKEVMLHAPMSNKRHLALGPGALTHAMHQAEFISTLQRNLASIPHVRGVNNHMGSLLTEDPIPMGWLMAELKRRQLYFVDSRTSAQTQALAMAERIQLPSRKRDIFLDDERTPQAIRRQLRKALELASTQGSALAIGHPYIETLEVLETLPTLLVEYQVALVPASALMQVAPAALKPQASKSLSCLAPPPWLWPEIRVPIDPFLLPAITDPLNLK